MVVQIKVFQCAGFGYSRKLYQNGSLPTQRRERRRNGRNRTFNRAAPGGRPTPSGIAMNISTIQLGDEGQVATRELVRRFAPVVPEALATCLRTFESIDRHHGGSGPLPLEDAGDLADAALADAASLDHDDLTLGIALWAVRHQVPLRAVEPVANALARRSNAAAGKPELSAVVGLMHGVIGHVAPALAADLERSNPERPWRILHVNLAITAIRTEDPALMDLAFDALDRALPDERAGFYAEALALALAPRVAPAVRDALEARHRRWTQG